VTGSGTGITVNDPGMNKLAMITTPLTPLGPQRIELRAPNSLPAFVDAIVMRTPGQAGLALGGIGSRTGVTGATMQIEQLSANRYAATFNAMPKIEFERQGDFGGAALCPNHESVGVVLSANGRRAGVSSPWAVILQELRRSTPQAPHVLEAQRFTADGKVGLVPLVYLTPDCTLAVIVDVFDNPAGPYRVRMYDLLTRAFLGSAAFNAAEMIYSSVRVELFPGDATAMTLLTSYPGATSRIALPHRAFTP
jgi:hypothetical protein